MGEKMLNKTFYFFVFFLLFISIGNAQEKSENNLSYENIYYREAIQLYKHTLPLKTDLVQQNHEEESDTKDKIKYLLDRGYCQIDNYIEIFYDESIYKMVYLSFSLPDGYVHSEFENDGMVYVLKYIYQEGKSRDSNPNFYTIVTIDDNHHYLKFIKINYFLEHYIEDAWQYLDDNSIYTRKIFY
jgi:hypothetical protein